MLDGCIYGDGGRLTAMAIKRFRIFEAPYDPDSHSWSMLALWKEKHGHSLTPTKPKAPKRVKTDAAHKWCNGCEQVLPVASFCVDRSRARGLANRCRDCNAGQWKRNNHHLCKSCGMWCVGQTCRRCMTVSIRVRDTEFEAISAIPLLLQSARRELEEFIRSLNPRLTPDQRLRLLLERVCGTSVIK